MSRVKPDEHKLKIYGIETSSEVFLSDVENFGKEGYRDTSLTYYYFDGKLSKPSFNRNWVKVDSVPSTVEKLVSQPNINHRYELIEKEIASEKIPLVLKREEAKRFDAYEHYWKWKDEYRHLSSLYEEVSDEQPPKMVEVDFEYVQISEIEEIKDAAGFSYTVSRSRQWSHEGTRELTYEDVEHQLVDRIMFPDIMLSSKPSKLSSSQMYDIVRQHIKQNINLEVATITSDYAFCFAVEKLIETGDPYKKKGNWNRGGKPYRTRRGVKVFEMTCERENYKGYTPIPSMTGRNIEELKEKVDKYCRELMEEINKPFVDCEHCNGEGVILKEGM